ADLAGDETALARFRREIRHLARCEHPNIVKVLGSGVLPDGQLYYTMEHVPGCNLEQVWRELAGVDQEPTSELSHSTWTQAVLRASRKQREQSRAPARPTTNTEDGAPVRALPALPLPPLPELPSAVDDPGGYVRRVAALIRDAALALQAVHDQ